VQRRLQARTCQDGTIRHRAKTAGALRAVAATVAEVPGEAGGDAHGEAQGEALGG
jgi:hypothetical protein